MSTPSLVGLSKFWFIQTYIVCPPGPVSQYPSFTRPIRIIKLKNSGGFRMFAFKVFTWCFVGSENSVVFFYSNVSQAS